VKKFWSFFVTVAFLLMPVWAGASNESGGTITMEFDLSGQDTNEEAQLWILYPLSDRDQLISKVSVSGDYAESAVNSTCPDMTGFRWTLLTCVR